MKRRTRERQEKRGDRQPILKKLHAALLQPFKGQHDKKMGLCKGSVWDNCDPQESQQPF